MTTELSTPKKEPSSPVSNFLTEDDLLSFIQKNNEHFAHYQNWLRKYPVDLKIDVLLGTLLEIVSSLQKDAKSKMSRETFPLQNLRRFTVVLVELFSQALAEIKEFTLSDVQTTDIFLQKLDILLRSLQKIVAFRQCSVNVMPLESLFCALSNQIINAKFLVFSKPHNAEFSVPSELHNVEFLDPRKLHFNLTVFNLLHHWIDYDRTTLTLAALSQAMHAAGIFAQHGYLRSKPANLKMIINWFEKNQNKKNISVLQSWYLGLGRLCEYRILVQPLNVKSVNLMLRTLATAHLEHKTIQAGKAYWGFAKLLKSSAISDPKLLNLDHIHAFLHKFFQVNTSSQEAAYTLRNLFITSDYLDGLNVSIGLLQAALINLYDGMPPSLTNEEVGMQIGRAQLTSGELIRSYSLYADITPIFVKTCDNLSLQLAGRAQAYIFPPKDSSDKKIIKLFVEFVRSVILTLRGLAFSGISELSEATRILADFVIKCLTNYAAFFKHQEYLVLTSQFALFLSVTQKDEEPLEFVTKTLSDQHALCLPKPGAKTYQTEIARHLEELGCTVKMEHWVCYFVVDIYYELEDGRAAICEVNGFGHHVNNPRLGEETDYLKSLILQNRGLPVFYFDFTEGSAPSCSIGVNGKAHNVGFAGKAYDAKSIAKFLFDQLSQLQPVKDKKLRKEPEQFYQYLAARIPSPGKNGVKLKTIAPGIKVASGTIMPSELKTDAKLLTAEYAPIEIEEAPRRPKIPTSTPKTSASLGPAITHTLMDYAIAGDIDKVEEIFNGPTPINPYSQAVDRYVFAAALIMALQAEKHATEAKSNARKEIREVILFLVDHVKKEYLNEERCGISPIILAKKWQTVEFSSYNKMYARLAQNKKSDIDPVKIARKAEQYDNSEIHYTDLLKAQLVLPKETKYIVDNSELKKIRISGRLCSYSFAPLELEEAVRVTKVINSVPLRRAYIRAQKGDALAQFAVGRYYLHENNISAAIDWFTQASKIVTAAQLDLGDIYKEKLNPPNFEAAFFWFKEAAERGSSLALISLADFFEKGDFVEKNDDKYLELLSVAADLGNPEASYRLGQHHSLAEFGLKEDLQKAQEYFEASAAAGHPLAQRCLADFYNSADGQKQEDAIYISLLEKAADQDQVEAIFRLGLHYEKGEKNLTKNLNTALGFYIRAAEQFYYSALIKLVQFYFRGFLDIEVAIKAQVQITDIRSECRAISKIKNPMFYSQMIANQESNYVRLGYFYNKQKNYQQERQCYQIAADKGDHIAQYELGRFYYLELAGKKEKPNCLDWLKKSSEQGYPKANLLLGVIFAEFEEYQLALNYFTLAAEANNTKAQFYLGDLYSGGDLGEINLEQAKLWYGRAAENGHQEAKKRYDAIKPVSVEVQTQTSETVEKGEALDSKHTIGTSLATMGLLRKPAEQKTSSLKLPTDKPQGEHAESANHVLRPTDGS